MGRIVISAAALALAVASARAASIAYVTDMPAFEALSALSYNIQSQTYDACPEAVSELQSCVCTKNNNFVSISSKISLSISYSCGSTASEDQTSAQSVLSAYCDPAATISFATPTAVTAYITDIPEFEYLAPCAQSAIRYAVGTMTYDHCPTDAPALASCACKKNQNSLVVSQIINSSAKSSCSGHSADITSAQAMFAAYCAMNDGTTSFPVPSKPPGDMTYYITDLPGYSSLAPCAASGLRYAVQSQSAYLCPSGPQALASCVCLKGGMTNDVLKEITSSVKYQCSSTASEDVSSAVSVFNYYCSAAAAQVTAAGVSNSVEQSYPASRAPGGPQQTGAGGSGGGNGNSNSNGSGTGNGNGNGDAGSNGSNGSTQGGDSQTSSSPSTGVIVGAVVGGVGGLALIGAIVFFVLKAVRKNRPDSLRIPDNAPGTDDPPVPLVPLGGKSELHSESIAGPLPAPSPSPSTLKAAVPARADNVSPVSAHTGAFTPPPNNQSELSGQASFLPPMPNRPELHSQPTGSPPPLSPGRPELQGQGQTAMFATPPPPNAPELYGQGSPQPNRPELQGQGAMSPGPPNAPELYGQGAPSPNRPELHGQGAMYATPPPANMSELQGQGSQFYNANPNRPELAGQYNYSPQQQQSYPSPQSPHMQQQQQQQQPYSPQQQQSAYMQQQQQQQQYPSPVSSTQGYHTYQSGSPPPAGVYGQPVPPHPQASWQSGPVPDLHEMDGGRGMGQR
ncbi:hypothetical protein C8A01DRAFT_38951 [Parachaetomium inaequale]|uniref:Uncharacterized protein n=1 Tax=Parachaetomium inaequale TaxID=2588326 RepID=A0AAN6PBV5_9PEZI|nr:hypothetical protein C8A01DRAFT_38951 [Parachaetomium inaequale]